MLFRSEAKRLRLGPESYAAAPGHIPSLDGLRALSILIVVCGHFFLPGNGGVAALGVYLFFAISGFLITRLLFLELQQSGRINLPAFYLRRVLRLYPVLIAFTIMLVVTTWAMGLQTRWLELIASLFYFVNYLISWMTLNGQELTLPVGALWSLSVEEHFYLIMPLAFVAFGGRIKPLALFALAAIILPLVLRCVYVVSWPAIIDQLITYRNSETRFDSIAVGVLLAVVLQSNWRDRAVGRLSNPLVFWCAAAAFVAVAAIPGAIYRETLRFSLISVACLPIIVGAVFGTKLDLVQRTLNFPAVAWIGRLSYSLYVWHLAVAFVLDHVGFHAPVVIGGLLKLALSFAVATISYYCIEMPALRLKPKAPRGKN